MPMMDGYQFLAALRMAGGRVGAIPVVFLTARGLTADRIQASNTLEHYISYITLNVTVLVFPCCTEVGTKCSMVPRRLFNYFSLYYAFPMLLISCPISDPQHQSVPFSRRCKQLDCSSVTRAVYSTVLKKAPATPRPFVPHPVLAVCLLLLPLLVVVMVVVRAVQSVFLLPEPST